MVKTLFRVELPDPIPLFSMTYCFKSDVMVIFAGSSVAVGCTIFLRHLHAFCQSNCSKPHFSVFWICSKRFQIREVVHSIDPHSCKTGVFSIRGFYYCGQLFTEVRTTLHESSGVHVIIRFVSMIESFPEHVVDLPEVILVFQGYH